jgi:hypothetical protein
VTLLIWFESFVLAGWSCIVLYGLLLCVISWITRRREAPLIFPRHVFALVIPVEDEEETDGRTLEHVRQGIKYPRNMFDVIVVPVTSTDRIATIARQKGAIVLGPGKRKWRDREEALLSSLERLASRQRYDAFVILGAGVQVSSNFLSVLSDKLSKGAFIIQSGYHITGERSSWKSGLLAILYALSPSWLTGWSGRFRLGGGLHTTGVCLSRRIVEKYGVRSPAVTDMGAYTLRLLRDDVVVTFADRAIVYDHGVRPPAVPSVRTRLKTRWTQIRQDAGPLIRDGIAWGSIAQVLGGINLLLPSFPVMIGGALGFLGLSIALHGMGPITIGWMGIVAALLTLVALRLAYARAPLAAYAVLPSFPFFLFWQTVQAWLYRPGIPAFTAQEGAIEPAAVKRNRPSRQRMIARRDARRQAL